MIIKFCFQGEIHRTSEPPQEFSALKPFLTKMFANRQLPEKYTLSCSTPDGLEISLNSQEDYEVLKSRNYKKPFKVFIIAEPELSVVSVTEEISPEEVNIEFETSQNKVFSGTVDLEEKIKDLEIQECISIAQEGIYTSYYKMPEETIDSQVQLEANDNNHNDQINSILFSKGESMEDKSQSQYYEAPRYFNFTKDIEQECFEKAQEVNKNFNEAEIRNIVRETIEQQMPNMFAQFKQALINEGLIPSRPQQQPQYYPNNSPYYHIPQHYQQPQPQYYQARHIPPQPIHCQQQQYVSPSYPQQQQRPQYYQPPSQSQPQPRMPLKQGNSPKSQSPDLIGKVFHVLSDIPGKAVQMVDSFAQIIEGDPYIVCEEGKYPRSVVEKATHMRQVFPKASKKEMLEFVQRFPRETSLDELIGYWPYNKQQK